MDKNKQPGIKFLRVFLSKLKYELPKVKPKDFEYNLDFTDSFQIKGNRLIYIFDISLYDRFQLELTAVFETIKGEENLDLEQFANINAPAFIFPFAREVISNITSRTPLPNLLLPPVNLIAIKNEAAKIEKKSKKKVENKSIKKA
ncbi:MAG: protein-export chaperone SecB [Actinobacteria bacterium]|nr:protein-export chaperone SecB [Actinomycetota bacterium]